MEAGERKTKNSANKGERNDMEIIGKWEHTWYVT
jgi:hypothetical protein